MESTANPPRLAVIVANGITGDSRVQKAAIAAARDGWDVTLIGRAAGKTEERSMMGTVKVLRIPVADLMTDHVRRSRGHRFRRSITQFGIADRDALARYRADFQTWLRMHTAELGDRGTVRSRLARRVAIRVRRSVHNFRNKVWGWEESKRPKAKELTGTWRGDWPVLLDLDLAFGPVIEKLQPHVIHANDITMIHTAALSAARQRARGVDCAWLYDAHEYVTGVDWRMAVHQSAFPALEKEFIGRADAVVTVSPQIADLLKKDYHLPETPLVVRNTPIRETIGVKDGPASVRTVCGLDDDVPLLVYSGWISAERGLGTAVGALPALPGYHLAIVAGRMSPDLVGLLERATELEVRDRVHVVPYVPQHAVPDYLSSADLGLICSKRTLNYEISLPTKLSEYLHGGVPVVASDVRTLSEFVETNGVGEVFRSDDEASFAEAVLRVMGRRAELVSHITEPILEELSWEHQSAGLVALYRRISAVVPAAPAPEVSWDVEERPWPRAGAATTGPVSRRWRALQPTSRIRLGIGPANYAGQAAAFARAASAANKEVSAEVFMYQTKKVFGFPADVYIETGHLLRTDVQIAQINRIIGRYTHLIADAFLPVLGKLNGEDIGADLPALRKAGIKVALLAHGSEVRNPGRHMADNEHSHFFDAPDGIVERLTKLAERNQRIAEESGLPLFVTTPDLLDDLPTAKWAPLVIDVDTWTSDKPIMERRRPIVLHAPSTRWTKGTDRIMPTLTKMHDDGAIDLRLVEDLAWAEMRDLVRDCDIVLDQFTTGAYGTFACEAMAAGKPVVAYISERVSGAVGADLPILNATPVTLGKVIDELIDDRDRARRIGARSAAFARSYHDGTWTARVLGDFLT
jgi:glycosyltransferase involved in cell wall biosynthesis